MTHWQSFMLTVAFYWTLGEIFARVIAISIALWGIGS
jgi:hypothetical protein